MCVKPIEIEPDVFVSCRECDECLGARKHDWVSRCVAEVSMNHGSHSFDLTYANDKEGNTPPHARIFQSKHVSAFIKRLREQYYREHGRRAEIRYVAAGERGTEVGRVHWHIIVFAKLDILKLGEWKDFNGNVIDPPEPPRKFLHWNNWPHGHLMVKPATQKEIRYLAKYAFKHLFNSVKSEGTKRYDKCDNHGASKFIPAAKRPPVGWLFLEKIISDLEQSNAVLPNTQIRVPGLNGYWYPKGKFRERLLDAFYQINTRHQNDHGRPCPQWSSLLHSCSGSEKDMEWLNGEAQENLGWEAVPRVQAFRQARKEIRDLDFETERFRRQIEQADFRRCMGLRLCYRCAQSRTDEEREADEANAQYWAGEWDALGPHTQQDYQNRSHFLYRRRGIHPGCRIGKEARSRIEHPQHRRLSSVESRQMWEATREQSE